MTQIEGDIAKRVLTELPIGVMTTDGNGVIQWCNSMMATILGKPAADLLEKSIDQIDSRVLRPDPGRQDLMLVPGVNNHPKRWLKCVSFAVGDGTAESVKAHCYLDITAQMTLQVECDSLTERLNKQVMVEPVSGLFNRRAMFQALEPLVSRSRRYHNSLSLVVMKVGNFARLNGDISEAAANHVIVELSHLLRDQMRWADLISRIEGDLFVLVLPETDQSAAVKLAHKLSNTVEQARYCYDQTKDIPAEVSFGVAQWQKGDDATLLLKRACAALSSASEAGCYTVCASDGVFASS